MLSDTNYRHRAYLIVRLTVMKNINDENITIHLVGFNETFFIVVINIDPRKQKSLEKIDITD